MKKNIIFLFVFSTILINGFSQNAEGPVLKPEIAGKYEGELKKGLANGKGTATGIETYTGHFSRGLPEGEGVYTFRNGNVFEGEFKSGMMEGRGKLTIKRTIGDSIVTGYWDTGKYVGTKRIQPYEISNKKGSVQEHISRIGEGNNIEISVMDPFFKLVNARIFAEGQYRQEAAYGKEYFKDVTFPIFFDIRYSCSNKLRTGIVESTIYVKINKPGNWIITLKN
jgi:hypothetical protein